MSICICGSPRPGEHCDACDVTHPFETADEVKARYQAVLSALREIVATSSRRHIAPSVRIYTTELLAELDRLEVLHGLKEQP